MSLNLLKKKEIVLSIKENIKNSLSIVVMNFNKAKSNQMNELRKSCRECNISLMVVRNKLLKFALIDTSIEYLKNHFIGQNIIAFSNKNPQDAAKLFKEFSGKNSEFTISFGIFDGNILLSHDIDLLASLPSHKEAITQLIATMQYISIGKFIHTLLLLKSKIQ